MSGSTGLIQPIDEGKLASYVRFLVGSFRFGEAEDGAVLTRGLTALLGVYPEWVVRSVCDPRSGLPARSPRFPTLYEVRTACEARMAPVVEAERRRRLQAEIEADARAPISEADSARRRAFIAEFRLGQALQTFDAEDAPLLADMDARKLHGEHKAMVERAIDAKLERLKAAAAEPMAPLSAAALAAAERALQDLGSG